MHELILLLIEKAAEDGGGSVTVKTIYKNNDYEYVLYTDARESQSHARIVRRALQDKEGDVAVFDYSWPAQLTVEVEAGAGSLREDGVLCWELFVTAHHVSGMAQGEFTETEYFELESPFGKSGEMVCRTVDIIRKTRFAIAERHLRHLPHQTYPAVDGKQGPYGHP
jgi:hypothetical protein